MTDCAVGLVLVSHSAKLAEGLVEMAAQMAPDVPMRAAGGCLDGRIGTSYERVRDAVEDLLAAGVTSVVLLTDLGSATLTVDAVIEGLEDERLSFVEAPLVEGAVAAAVAAQTGGDCADVRRALLRVGASFARESEAALVGVGPAGLAATPAAADRERVVRAGAPPEPVSVPAAAARGQLLDASVVPAVSAGPPNERRRTLHLVNRLGLHARPAALLARAAGAFDAVVTANGVAADSVLELMSLGLELGSELHLAASGPEADEALGAIEELVEAGFGEE